MPRCFAHVSRATAVTHVVRGDHAGRLGLGLGLGLGLPWPGDVFELNNKIYHKADNPSTDGYLQEREGVQSNLLEYG